MNWAIVARRICEAYLGVTSADVGRMTIDQILVMVLPLKYLQSRSGAVVLSTADAAALGLVKRDSAGESLVQRIRASKEYRERKARERAERREARRKTRDERRAEIERQAAEERKARRKARRRRRR